MIDFVSSVLPMSRETDPMPQIPGWTRFSSQPKHPPRTYSSEAFSYGIHRIGSLPLYGRADSASIPFFRNGRHVQERTYAQITSNVQEGQPLPLSKYLLSALGGEIAIAAVPLPKSILVLA